MKRSLALGVLLFAGSIGNAQATTITFDDLGFVPPPPFNTQPFDGDLIAGGFFFDMAGNPSIYQLANNSANINNGTVYAVIEGDPLSQTTISQVGGAAFALISLDYAKWQGETIAAATTTITVTGNQVGGGSVSQVLSPVGDFTSGGGGTDFQTSASFGPGWGNLTSVVLTGTGATFGTLNYFAIDNIIVETAAPAVPEPGTLTLLGLGSAYLIRRRRRNHR
jgi:hypothetical protein